MTFGESVKRAQGRCRAVLLERIAQRKTGGGRVIAEAAPRDASGSIVSATDGLKLPLRYDLVFEDSTGKFQTENADSVTIEFGEPLFVTWERTLEIEIHRLCWDYMPFEIATNGDLSWDWLRNWFLKWFDVTDTRPSDAEGLLGVVHFVSDPVIDDGLARFFVDFGSSSSDALAEFLDALLGLRVTHCAIGKKQTA